MSDGNSYSITVTAKGKRPIVMVGAWEHEIKVLKSDQELAEWERRIEALLGEKVDAKEVMRRGGCCCGGGGGMCDYD